MVADSHCRLPIATMNNPNEWTYHPFHFQD
jgi:hypothetical protein